jgi:hypothetical protein
MLIWHYDGRAKVPRKGETARLLCKVNTAACCARWIIESTRAGFCIASGCWTSDAKMVPTRESPAPVTLTTSDGSTGMAGKCLSTKVDDLPLEMICLRDLGSFFS